MTWNRRYVLKGYILGALWIVPVAYLVFARIAEALNLTVAGARPLLETVITLNMSFIVFTFGSLLGRDSGRRRAVHATDHRNDAAAGQCHPVFRRSFVLTLLFALRALIRMDGEIIHQFNVFLAATLGLQPPAAGGRGRDGSWSCWIARSRRSTRFPRTWRLPAFQIRRGWGAISASGS